MYKAYVFATLVICCVVICHGQHPNSSPKPGSIPASSNVTDLNEYTFSQTADGRVWFVEFYAEFCRNCR
jgi:hypothetical protein